jgi:XTP/dITP diphosphohydrolase
METRKLVISTGNKNKVKEIAYMLRNMNIEVISKNDIGLGDLEVIEDGNTLEDNSILKAKALAEKVDYKYMVMADDSGLFVDKLNGEPGVYSSRYAGEEGNDERNNRKLLEALKDTPIEERDSKFKTVIVLITENKETLVVEGECKGTIGLRAKGNNGFGYDPLFIPEGFKETFGELGEDIKNKISHRAKALEKLKEEIEKIN